MVQVERNVYTALSACAHVTIKGLQYRLVRVEIVEAVSPDSIVSRNANEIESLSIHEIESPFVCRPWPPACSYEHPLEVESVVRQFDTVTCSRNVSLGIHAPQGVERNILQGDQSRFRRVGSGSEATGHTVVRCRRSRKDAQGGGTDDGRGAGGTSESAGRPSGKLRGSTRVRP